MLLNSFLDFYSKATLFHLKPKQDFTAWHYKEKFLKIVLYVLVLWRNVSGSIQQQLWHYEQYITTENTCRNYCKNAFFICIQSRKIFNNNFNNIYNKSKQGHARTVHQKYVFLLNPFNYHINCQMKNVDYLNCKVYTVLFFHCIMSFSLIYMTSIKNIQYNFADKVTKTWFHHPCLMLVHLMLKSWSLKQCLQYFNITQCKCLTVTTFLFGKTLNYYCGCHYSMFQMLLIELNSHRPQNICLKNFIWIMYTTKGKKKSIE